MEFDNNTFKISCMIHPNTYMNKILVASEQGAFQLWNVRSGKLLYTFKGWKSAVTALQQVNYDVYNTKYIFMYFKKLYF